MKKLLLFLPIVLFGCMATKSDTIKSPDGTWELDYVSTPQNSFDTLYSNSRPTLIFDSKQGRVSGNNSCNQYSGGVKLDGPNVIFEEKGFVSTKMFCPGDGERIYMQTLRKANKYALSPDSNTLTLLTDDIAILRFIKK